MPFPTSPPPGPRSHAAHGTHAVTTVDDHAALVRGLIAPAMPTESEYLPLLEALNRVTASPVRSPVDLPLFRNSQMDGFAVRAADVAAVPVTLPIVGEVAARPGEPPFLAPGTAVRIMTGAIVPEGADAVIPVEDTTVADTATATVTVNRGRTAGVFVRDRGSDVRAGEQILPGGLRLGPRHLAVLAAAGLATVAVVARVQVAIITTGAELVAPGEAVSPGQVYDANGIALATAVIACGAEVCRSLRVVDDPAAMLDALRIASATADIILTSGGISMGDYEVVREVLGPLGATIGHIAMQPGGPQVTGSFEGVPVVSFPGNPVSTQISFEVFVAPILREAAGLPPAAQPTLTLAADLVSVPGKRQFLRGRTLPGGEVELVSGPSSHLVAGLAASDVLLDIPVETLAMTKGDPVKAWQL